MCGGGGNFSIVVYFISFVEAAGVEPADVLTFTHGLRYRELRFQMPSEKLKNRGR